MKRLLFWCQKSFQNKEKQHEPLVAVIWVRSARSSVIVLRVGAKHKALVCSYLLQKKRQFVVLTRLCCSVIYATPSLPLLSRTHLKAALLHREAQTRLSHVLPGCVFNSNRSFSRLVGKLFPPRVDTNHPFVFPLPTETITDLSVPHSSLCSLYNSCVCLCLSDCPASKIPAGNYNAVL